MTPWLNVSVRVGALIFALAMVFGCASTSNTPAQDLAWERWKKCDRFPSVTLREIRPNGQIWVLTQHGADLTAWRECDREVFLAQQKAGRLPSSAVSVTSAEAARGLVRFAYFTDEPPDPDTFLRGDRSQRGRGRAAPDLAVLRSLPPDQRQFQKGAAVSFIYAVDKPERTLAIETRWTAPNEAAAVKVFKRSIAPGGEGTYKWQTQTLRDLADTGKWTVVLLIDGQIAGSYDFHVVPEP